MKKQLDEDMMYPGELSGVISYHISFRFILRITPTVKSGIESVEVSGIKVILNDS